MSMNSKTPLLIYTHSAEEFIWKVLVGQIAKHVKGLEIHFAYNDSYKGIKESCIPSDWILHTYNEEFLWTKRVNKVLKEISSDYVLFIHEDWLPTGDTNGKIVDDMTAFMGTRNIDFLLSYAHISTTSIQQGIDIGYPGYYAFKEQNHIFQPAIWKHSTFLAFTEALNKGKNQNEDEDCLNFMRKKACYSVQNLATVLSLRTTNALFFPHMHALSQNLWHSRKYPGLLPLIQSYGIDTSTRGAHTWWELDTQ
jgi:hypothetical protein